MTEKQNGYRIGWLMPVEALCYGSLLGFGPQGDAIRINNLVRLVRTIQ